MTICPPTHLVPPATGWKTTWDVLSHMPIWVPSGLQTSVPGALQEEDPAAPAAGAAPVEPEEPEELDDEVLPGATAGAGAALGAAEATGGDTAGTLLGAGGEPGAELAPAAKTPPDEEG
jgi:hypothetical protein